MRQALFLFLVIFILFINPSKGYGNSNEGADYGKIPEESIRLRILANSNADVDQQVKRLIRDEINKEITNWVEELVSIDDARALIQQRLDRIDVIVGEVLKEHNIEQSYDVEYGNVSFPTKLYGDFVYPAGEYEAILVTLGDGKGDNWWCVLFPPLCFLDFSDGTTVATTVEGEEDVEVSDKQKVEVKFFVIEWIEKLLTLFS
ncbi:stage II sporulation protein R [Salirhabdus salicampi]|uniref:stage II sporulation protein R n=1 Tax=Salirhabdus salicampi TaxID=476102 RepID=UPI0020C4966A|nr:stage II sporulation protein R [Salirhabdus salicampi]MCP8617421.1 stage II sporulation protein R [Salirhabdus salicampi]